MMNGLPLIERTKISQVVSDWDFIQLFFNHYSQLIDENEKVYDFFNEHQYTLMYFVNFHSQIAQGGFLQLIQNGFGGYLFDSNFSADIKSWGAAKISDVIEEVRLVYESKKEMLESETTLEEFVRLYEEHPEFSDFDNRFEQAVLFEMPIIVEYIKHHLTAFAVLV